MDSAHTHMIVYVLSLTHASLVAVPSLSRKAGKSPVMGSYTGMAWKEKCGEENWIGHKATGLCLYCKIS